MVSSDKILKNNGEKAKNKGTKLRINTYKLNKEKIISEDSEIEL